MTTKSINVVKEYRAKEAINYSSLSALSISPQVYIARDSREVTAAFRKGSAVDCLLTTPDDFHSEFYVMNVKKMPTDMMTKYIDELFISEDHDKAYLASGYKSKPETIKAKYEEEGKEYYEARKDSRGKTILAYNEYEHIQMAVNQVKEGEFTREYFPIGSANPIGGGTIQRLYQFPIYWETKGHACKSLLDLLVIDHENKEIFPIDLKTTGKSALSFRSAFVKWKYYLQASFYTEAVNFWKNNDTDLVDYTVKNFKFIVVETEGLNPPIIYETSDADLFVGRNGGTDYKGNRIKGFVELIDDLNYHDKSGNWEFPREIHENNGVAMLDTMKVNL